MLGAHTVALAADPGPEAPQVALLASPQAALDAQAAWAAHLNKPATWTNSVGMKMILIPPGEFVMGAPGDADAPPHTVRITKPYYMAATEVTRAQWEAVTGNAHSTFFPGPDQPMNNMRWYDAVAFNAALSKAENLDKANSYVLPSEAQWELAARAGTTTHYATGDDEAALDKAGWFQHNSGATTHPVAQKQPNALGLYDMHGNVWEWCEDYYEAAYYRISPKDDPTGPATSLFGYRVLRGGSIYYQPVACRSGNRAYFQSSRSEKHIGFRPILPVEAVPANAAK